MKIIDDENEDGLYDMPRDDDAEDSFHSRTEVKWSSLYNMSSVLRKKLEILDKYRISVGLTKTIRQSILERLKEVEQDIYKTHIRSKMSSLN